MIELRNEEGDCLYRCDLDSLDNADMKMLNLRGLSAEGLVAYDADFSGAILERADLYWAILFGSNFTDANLRNAILCGADLKRVNFTRADLRSANLGKDNLNGDTDVQDAVFTDAVYNSQTIFPDGFDPLAHGMRWQD
jgi:uncharacterized protein YjbI with pentapeptide repeats